MSRRAAVITALLVCFGLCAQASVTRVRQVVVTATGNKASGYITIYNDALGEFPANGYRVWLALGLFAVNLAPYNYVAEYHLSGAPVYRECWTVPVSTTPLNLSSIRVSCTATPGALVWSTLTSSGWAAITSSTWSTITQ